MDYNEKEFEYFALHVGLKIGYYRRLAGLTQEKLAEEINSSTSYIGQLESPSLFYCPSLKTLYKIAKVLGVDIVKLVDVEHD